jgi:hypothetical protein
VQKYGFLADVFMSQNPTGSIFHYIIQRNGDAEILFWGQERSLKDALERVQHYLLEAQKVLRISSY